MVPLVIVPTEEELKIESNGWVCPVGGCKGTFQTSSQLQMHLTKRHEGRELSVRSGTSHYYCPVQNCERSLPNKRPFPRLGQLKQHYQRIHGAKDYKCEKCGKQFSLKDAHQRHTLECGKLFSCESCGEMLKTRNALYKHAKRKGHALPEGSKPKEKKASSLSTPIPPLPLPPIIIKQVVKLPKTASSSTQTEQDGTGTQFNIAGGSSAVETYISDVPHAFMGTTLLNLGTQTESESQAFDISDFATQTDFTQAENGSTTFYLNDFATQSNFTQTEPNQCFTFSDLATQTDLEPNSNAGHSFYFNDLATQTDLTQTGTNPTGGQSFDFLETQTDFTQTEPDGGLTGEHTFDLSDLATQTEQYFSVNDLATQTDPGGEHSFNPSDLATQTENYFSGNDLTTQTSFTQTDAEGLAGKHSFNPSDLATQTENCFSANDLTTQTSFTQTDAGGLAGEHSFHPPDLATQNNVTSYLNFGTQTPDRTASQSSQTTSALHTVNQGCQTTMDAPSGDQVDPSTFPGYEECLLVEFGTQTSRKALLGIATQTSPTDFYMDFEGLQPRADFGTQTIEELFSNYLPPPVDVVDSDQAHASPGHLDFSAQADLPTISDHVTLPTTTTTVTTRLVTKHKDN